MQPFRNIALLLALILPAATLAQGSEEPALTLELNTADNVGEACRLTFLLSNGLERDIDKLVAETGLFSDEGEVILLTLFDFGELPVGRPRVRQFRVPDTSCERLGQVLVNGLDTCQIAGEQSGHCTDALEVSSRVRIGMEG